MSALEHKRVFRRLIEEGFNGGRLAVLDELLTSDFVDHSPCHLLGGREELQERITLLRVTLPDLRIAVEELAAAGDMIWATVAVRGTACGVPGMPAKQCLGFRRIDSCRFADGRIAEYWSETADLMEQLGIAVT